MKSLTGSFLIALLAVALLPQASFGQIPYGLGLSCNNSMLTGSYAAQMGIDYTNAVANANGTNGSSAADAGFGSSSGIASSLTLSGKLLGLSRFYFDGNGGIIGASTSTTVTVTGVGGGLAGTSSSVIQMIPAGSYTVNPDCTGTVTLTQGTTNLTFNAVIASNGSQVLIQETDSSNPGAVGTLVHGPNFCGNGYNNPQSFAFSYDGLIPGTAASGSTAATPATLYSNLGILTLDGAGNFNITYWENKGGTITRVGTNSTPSFGTYTINNTTCAVSLTYSKSGTAGPAFNTLATAGGLGAFTVSPTKTQPMIGTFFNVGRAVTGTYGVVNQ